MESNESPILAGLNPAQRDAVIHYDVPSLIIAGAGSGKTRVLTSRIAYMIEQGVAPERILALTFTNKAAEQMRTRIAQMLPDNRARRIRMGTAGAWQIQRHGPVAGSGFIRGRKVFLHAAAFCPAGAAFPEI